MVMETTIIKIALILCATGIILGWILTSQYVDYGWIVTLISDITGIILLIWFNLILTKRT